jgi:hypothetical protein
MSSHPDDEFHPPSSPDPDWTETCWFTFAVPERRLSGQLYPFFRPNLGVAAGGAFVWDDAGDQIWTARYAKNFWHLPIPDQPLSDITLANGIAYTCLEPLRRYHVRYRDPDADALEIDLVFTAAAPEHRAGKHHIDQPGRYRGTIRLDDEVIPVDAYGFRDRSWGLRSQVGPAMFHNGFAHGGYSYASESDDNGFQTITWDRGNGRSESVHGHLRLAGEWAPLAQATRTVLARDPATGCPTELRIDGSDTLGRPLEAHGRARNKFGFAINPNMWTWNCLTEWEFAGHTGWGEDHDNWSATGARRFFRDYLRLGQGGR